MGRRGVPTSRALPAGPSGVVDQRLDLADRRHFILGKPWLAFQPGQNESLRPRHPIGARPLVKARALHAGDVMQCDSACPVEVSRGKIMVIAAITQAFSLATYPGKTGDLVAKAEIVPLKFNLIFDAVYGGTGEKPGNVGASAWRSVWIKRAICRGRTISARRTPKAARIAKPAPKGWCDPRLRACSPPGIRKPPAHGRARGAPIRPKARARRSGTPGRAAAPILL